MTQPRQILPGRSYLVTRRTTHRQFLLRPSRATNENVKFCLGLAAERTGVVLHAVCVMSNHWHGVVTDPEARLPEFIECFHKLLAKAQNALLGRWENLWSSDKTSVVLLTSEQDVLDKMRAVSGASIAERIAAIRRLCEFVRCYRAAWQEWREGNRDKIFPAGTYALRVHGGVRCEDTVPG